MQGSSDNKATRWTEQTLHDYVTAKLIRISGPPHPADITEALRAVQEGVGYDDRIVQACMDAGSPAFLAWLQKLRPNQVDVWHWDVWEERNLATPQDAEYILDLAARDPDAVPDRVRNRATALAVIAQ